MNFPSSHGVQAEDLALLYEPGRHVRQSIRPVPVENWPAWHDWHALTPVAEGWNCPGEHRVHTDELVLLAKVPAAQTVHVSIPVPVV